MHYASPDCAMVSENRHFWLRICSDATSGGQNGTKDVISKGYRQVQNASVSTNKSRFLSSSSNYHFYSKHNAESWHCGKTSSLQETKLTLWEPMKKIRTVLIGIVLFVVFAPAISRAQEIGIAAASDL